MYVKMNFGPQAGKEMDISAEAAIGLLADGRASRAFQELSPLPVLTLSAAPIKSAPAKKSTKRNS